MERNENGFYSYILGKTFDSVSESIKEEQKYYNSPAEEEFIKKLMDVIARELFLNLKLYGKLKTNRDVYKYTQELHLCAQKMMIDAVTDSWASHSAQQENK